MIDCQPVTIFIVFSHGSQASVDLNIKWQGVTANLYTPLHLAAFKSYWSVIECLVGWGADLNSTDRIGYTPVRVIIVRKSDVKPTSPTLKMVNYIVPLVFYNIEVLP